MLEKEDPTDPGGNSHKGAAENALLGTQVISHTHAFHLRLHYGVKFKVVVKFR